MSLIDQSETERLKRIVKQEGEIIQFMKYNSAVVSIKTKNNQHDALHIHLAEIFSCDKYPVGQLLDLNKEKLLNYFPQNKSFITYLDKCIKTQGIMLLLIGEDYCGVKHYFIWDGMGEIPWKVTTATITREIIEMTKESLENLTNIISKVRYNPHDF
tara:strand:- start:307 stop:777 length:471 start_codon:yes stop_codon:yes gene_type:complete